MEIFVLLGSDIRLFVWSIYVVRRTVDGLAVRN